MNPEIKARWVAALRSGEYQQGHDVLKTAKGEFCCLGVLCDLYRAEHNMTQWDAGELRKSEDDEVPSHRVTRWAGLRDDNPGVRLDGRLQCVSNWNDSGRTFSEIADAIEEQL